MEKVTIVLHDPPYGTERVFNALRLAEALVSAGAAVRIFLYADSVVAAKKGHAPPRGFYNTAEMLAKLIGKGVEVRTCLTCTRARGLAQEDFIDGAVVGKTMDLARWVVEDGKVLVF